MLGGRWAGGPAGLGWAGCEYGRGGKYGRAGGRVEQIKACLNGSRGPGDHPAVPVSPAELAVSAAAAVAAGAEAVHLHARGSDGAESVGAADVGAAVAAVRRACPGTPVGVSTGLWITGGDAVARQVAVAGGGGLPRGARAGFAHPHPERNTPNPTT